MRTSESTKELVGALAKAQAEFPKVLKDSENPYFKSKYADLASIVNAVQDELGRQGLAVTQHLETEFQSYFDEDGTVKGERIILCVITRLEHNSGEFEESVLRVPVMDAKPQTLGSASTYARRYALQSILRVAAEADDDANAASLGKNWTDEERERYIKDKKAKLQKDIDEKVSKAKLQAQLEASVKDLGEAKKMDEDAAPRGPEVLLSDAQRKMIFAIAMKRGLSDGEIREAIGSLGYESLTELPKSKVGELMNEIDPEFKFHQRSTR